jgi:hypothetical protein
VPPLTCLFPPVLAWLALGFLSQGSALLSRQQSMWVESLQFVYRVTPGVVVEDDRNIRPWRLKLRAFVSSNKFEVGAGL